MSSFWKYARQMLYYRWLMVVSLSTATLDAMFAFGGLATLIWIVEHLFGEEGRTIHNMAYERLADERVQEYIGDQTHLANIIPQDQFWGLAAVMLVIVALAIMGGAMRVIYQLASYSVVLRTTVRIRKRAFDQLIHIPMHAFYHRGVSNNLTRVLRDCQRLRSGMHGLLGKAVRDILMGLSMMGLALIVDWQLALLFVITVPAIALAMRKFGKRIRKATKRASEVHAQMLQAMHESMYAMPVVKTHNAEGYERRRFHLLNRKALAQDFKVRTAQAFSSPVVETLAMIGIVLVSLVAAWLVFNDESRQAVTIVQVIIPLALAANSLKPLATLNNKLQESAAAAIRLDELFDIPIEPRPGASEHERATILPRHRAHVHFDNVSYVYPNSHRPAVQDAQVHIDHGSSVAFVGPNGSGKTTLLHLLPRLIDPSEGRVLIDGIDIANVTLRSLREQIAVVSQQTFLFAGSIAENIAYGQRYQSPETIEAAARAAFAHEFIVELPKGYKTKLGEGGSGLSGGQRQRLSLARAILRDPAILILDEATSQVDADSEEKINRALAQFSSGRTTLIVAHRLSTVIDADRIVVMEDGRVLDQGTHRELQQRCTTYQTLTRTQLQAAPA